MNLCIPVLKRYDLLKRLLLSLQNSTVQPDELYVIDNGRDAAQLRDALKDVAFTTIVKTPHVPMGVAESWNWFIDNTLDERFIVNDDIEFGPTSIEQMLQQQASFVSCTYGFACFLLRDECVERVGLFDETISPGYAYFEDRDYFNRMRDAEIVDIVVECGVQHAQSQTIAVFTPEEKEEHNRKFIIAQENFLKKWQVLPSDLTRQFA